MESSSQTCPGTARDQPPVSADIPSILCIVAAGLNTGLPSQTIPGPTAGSNGYRTIKEATVKRYHNDSHRQLQRHFNDFMNAYNHGRRLKTFKGLTPDEYICKIWTNEQTDPVKCRS